MVKKIKLTLASFVFTFFSFGLSAMAVDSTDSTGTDEMLQTTIATETEVKDDKSSGREARLKSYKEKTATKLAEAQSKRLKTRCKSAQGKVTTLRAKVNNAVANRNKVYKEIGDKLDTLIPKLTAAGADITKLETARADIRTELTTLTESLNAYDTVLADLLAMDCEADPDSFQSALESAREIQKTLREQAQEFRRFATTELRTILQEIRQQLAEKEASETPDTTDTPETTDKAEGEN